MNRRSILRLTAAGALAPLAMPRVASAQSGAWPTRGSIRLIAQFPPGGLVDTVSRLMAPALSQALSQTVVVENRAGAGGVIGTDFVAKQPADGYTLLVSHASVHVFSTATMPTLPFHPINDFTHMGMLVEASNVLLVKAESPYRTLDQYLTAARTRPVRYGSSGIGSAPHLLGAMLTGAANAPNLDHVPYRGSAPAMQDLMANQIESLIDPITTNVQLLKDGVLRALAVSTPQRLPAFPNIPTFAELGYPKLTSAQWLGLSAPKNLPAPIAERLTALIPTLLARPELMTRFEELQTLPRTPSLLGADFVRVMQEQITEWTAVARQYNIVVT
ncbi:tripartite tricarboxylate transporter substrate binding protein [Roseomonas sp. PWR1]|uniref:Tripartite tricarboxylate transporter substrate binding protein n=1 Tax=Roseomonas nitratireducens TaxID=2820810 RepID=A0ABS4AUB2_9PROT|nr:tripartite tricarboxylate transporter substrate binding protein [Neoroseomonas nitratireducens]MBP0464950.1 tripartite tricarboxylate transporter substrate binding protein [Neoroseomonas nitratireducens]